MPVIRAGRGRPSNPEGAEGAEDLRAAGRLTANAQGAGAQDMQATDRLAGAQTSIDIDIDRLAGAQTYRPAGLLAGAQTGALESRGLDACTGLLFPI